MYNIVSFDVEDYFQVGAFEDRVHIEDWDHYPSRVERNTHKILGMLEEAQAQGTFFVLGWVAERFPGLVRAIASQGHEVACHSFRHRRVFTLNPESFREDTRRAKAAIEDALGSPIFGYRAPNFSITEKSLWSFEVLAELGFRYDSSIFPIRHPNYGIASASRFPFRVHTPSGTLVEIPLSTIAIGSHRSPLSGGAYLRLLPYSYMRWGLRYINRIEKNPFCIYLHPWELDPGQPRLAVRKSSRLRHHLGIRSTEVKLARLLREFRFTAMRSLASQVEEHQSDAIPVSSIPVFS